MKKYKSTASTLFDGFADKTKICSKCHRDLPLSCFGTDGGRHGYLRHECKDCAKEQANILKQLKKSAPPVPDNYCCPICNRTEKDILALKPNKKGIWVLDHDHILGKFRGWICYKCNLALGNFNDSIERLSNAINYLNRIL